MLSELALEYIQDLDRPGTTKKTYGHGLKMFLAFVAESKYGTNPAGLPLDALVKFKRWLQSQDYKPRTVLNYLAAAQGFLRWLESTDRLADAHSALMDRRLKANGRPRSGGYVARKIDPDIKRLLSHYVDMPLPKQGGRRLMLLRNRALVAFLYDTAARISEALALTRADVVDGRADRVILYKTKGGKPRTVFVSEDTRNLLQEYIAARGDRSDAPLFVSHARDKGHELTARQAWKIVKDAAKAADLLDSTSPHCLRHARAQDLLDAGMPLDQITDLLGHESPGTTKNIYAPHVDTSRLGASLKEYGKSPLEWAKEG